MPATQNKHACTYVSHACMLTSLEGGWVVISARGELLTATTEVKSLANSQLFLKETAGTVSWHPDGVAAARSNDVRYRARKIAKFAKRVAKRAREYFEAGIEVEADGMYSEWLGLLREHGRKFSGSFVN